MKTGICGICGRMGMAITKVLQERGHSLDAAFDSDRAPGFGGSVSSIAGGSGFDVRITAIDRSVIKGIDCIIDFSAPAATRVLLEAAVSSGVPLVIGTTGLDDRDMEMIRNASGKIPVLFSPNMSVGVNLFFKLTEIASRAIPKGYDIEVMEAHHRFKKDAPSGTARKLVEIIKENVSGLADASEVPGRSGIVGERTDNEIGVMSIRGGDIVGEHTVFMAGTGERIEITHRATDRDIFARGAVTAAEFISGRKPGLYSMYDVIGL